MNRFVSFNQTLGYLRKTPMSESLVKSHDNNCKPPGGANLFSI